ncbi:MAG: cobalt ECF transporter T component CbiQ [Deltaproteobacteria bacterium]|jgi:cobalt/nickel transport system permease protein|nr:cobalt ECF transporter T component CbiQ [Deltaproteobacteria bacterium]
MSALGGTVNFLSRTDPRLKVLILVLWSFLLAFVQSRAAAWVGLVGSGVLYAFSGPQSLIKGLSRLLAINSFLIFIWLTLPFSFSTPGTEIYRLGWLALTQEGLDFSLILSLKALAITLGALAITSSSGVFELLAGAKGLGAPEKLVALCQLMTRYISVIGQQYARSRQAMRVRGFQPRTNLHTLRSYANLAGILLVRGLDRAERVRSAMLCRGYNGRFWAKTDFRLKFLDLGLAYLTLALGLWVTILDAA